MTPERALELVTRWARFYTRRLPTPIAQRRVDEIGADLVDHVAHERARSTSDRRIALSILSRMARGMTADMSWRSSARPRKGGHMKLVVALFAAALGVTLAIYAGNDDAPGGVLLGILLMAAAVVIGVKGIRSRLGSV